MSEQGLRVTRLDGEGIVAEALEIRILSSWKIVVRERWVRVVKRMEVEMGGRQKKALDRAGMDIAQSIFRRDIVPNGDVLNERPEIREESRKSG